MRLVRYLTGRVVLAVFGVVAAAALMFIFYAVFQGEQGSNDLIVGASTAQETQWGHDPAPVQFVLQLGLWITGHFGENGQTFEPMLQFVSGATPSTVVLVVFAAVFAALIGVPAGIALGMWHGRAWTRWAEIVATVLVATPVMFSGALLFGWFAFDIHLFPGGGPPPGWENTFAGFNGMVLPIATLGLPFAGRMALVVRSAVLDQRHSEYLRTALSKGCGVWRLTVHHLLRNAAIPILTFAGGMIPLLLSAAVIVEATYNIPGLGFQFVNATDPGVKLIGSAAPIVSRSDTFDYAQAVTIVLFVAVGAAVMSVLVDFVLGLTDPRIGRR